MRIALGSDHAGFDFKDKTKSLLLKLGHSVRDFGAFSAEPVDYPEFIRAAAEAVARGECERGIVFGASGNGEATVANKIRGIRCAVCWNVESVRLAREHNDANMISIGQRLITWDVATEIIKAALTTPFEGGRHLKRIQQIEPPLEHQESSIFGLDPGSVTSRVKASGQEARLPSLKTSLLCGSLGFALVSLIVFGIWAFAGRSLGENLSEAGFYAFCAITFVLLSGLLLHKLVIGPGSLKRFQKLFTLAFASYALVWSLAWFMLQRPLGYMPAQWIASAVGCFALGLILTDAFAVRKALPKILLVLFLTHSAGYFLGGAFYDFCKGAGGAQAFDGLTRSVRATLAKLGWGLLYGLGLGAGLGYTLYACQEETRRRLNKNQPHPE